ncbi:MAG TPA: diguanylate cyclase [Noviherbaspirillum sp.]
MTCIVLAITPDAAAASALQKVTGRARNGYFEMEWCDTLGKGIARITQGGVDIILGDFLMPDAAGMHVFQALSEAAPTTPIIMLCDAGYEDLGMETMLMGGQGYLPKRHCHNMLIPHMFSNIVGQSFFREKTSALKAPAEAVLGALGEGVVGTDAAGAVTYLNAAAERLTGWPALEALGRPAAEVLHVQGGSPSRFEEGPFASAQEARREPFHVDTVLTRRGGGEIHVEESIVPVYDRQNRLAGAVLTLRGSEGGPADAAAPGADVLHDPLTGLPGRLLLNDRMRYSMACARRNFSRVALLMLDIDNFQAVGDTYGQAAARQLLQQVAQRLVATVRGSDTVARLEEDGFAVLLREDGIEENVVLAAEKISSALAQPYTVGEHDIAVTFSVGAAIYPEDGADAGMLADGAEAALRLVKFGGGRSCRFVRSDIQNRLSST